MMKQEHTNWKLFRFKKKSTNNKFSRGNKQQTGNYKNPNHRIGRQKLQENMTGSSQKSSICTIRVQKYKEIQTSRED